MRTPHEPGASAVRSVRPVGWASRHAVGELYVFIVQRLLNAFAPSLATLSRGQIDAVAIFAVVTSVLVLALFIIDAAVRPRPQDDVRRRSLQVTIPGGSDLHDAPLNGLMCTAHYRHGAICLSLDGNLDPATISSFRAKLRSAAEPTDNLVLDLGGLQYIDPVGIHALVDAYQMLTLSGRRMALVAVPAKLRGMFTVAGAANILPEFATVEGAVETFRVPINPTRNSAQRKAVTHLRELRRECHVRRRSATT
jgi:anti-sigma B factor antagonist